MKLWILTTLTIYASWKFLTLDLVS
jgi:hypothetical protein